MIRANLKIEIDCVVHFPLAQQQFQVCTAGKNENMNRVHAAGVFVFVFVLLRTSGDALMLS